MKTIFTPLVPLSVHSFPFLHNLVLWKYLRKLKPNLIILSSGKGLKRVQLQCLGVDLHANSVLLVDLIICSILDQYSFFN